MTPDATIVLDIGKTNCKLTLIDGQGLTLSERRRPNRVLLPAPGGYPHHDSEGIWRWMLEVLGEFAREARIGAIVPVTHGATAALVDEAGALVLPILDYEYPLAEAAAVPRPPFAETCSPALPAGLNLGRQLAWLAQRFPTEFARTRSILLYPQYWAWRLCGVAASEVSSLGCHTDLWNPAAGDYSSLVERHGWRALFPPRREAWARLGTILPELAAATGLPGDCQIVCGVHDSNASLLRHLLEAGGPRTVLSTGTWVIAAALGGAATKPLIEDQDMLANCDVLGRPVPCMRFMGGREFGLIAGASPAPFGAAELQQLIARRTFALPCFAEAGGPFAGQGRSGHIVGPAPESPAEQAALATLYVVLMSDYCLQALGAEAAPVVVEGAFTANPFFGPLLAGLHEGREVLVSDDSSGTTCGAWLLQAWQTRHTLAAAALAVPAFRPEGWPAYRDEWLAQLA